MIRVMLVDDHTVLREGLRFLLQTCPEIEVVGDAADGIEAVQTAAELHPDVILMDITMPNLDGIEASRQILKALPEIKIIILSMQTSGEHVSLALQAGAFGYLLKESAGKDVIRAVQAVAEGEYFLSQVIAEMLVQNFIQASKIREPVGENPFDRLSPRELEILNLVLKGRTSAEIGSLLYLSPKTVETYRSRMMHKLGVTDLIMLIKLAIRYGLA